MIFINPKTKERWIFVNNNGRYDYWKSLDTGIKNSIPFYRLKNNKPRKPRNTEYLSKLHRVFWELY